MSDEEKLREEAARRLERRRRKMENATQRLAMITGLPESSINLNDSYCIDSPASSLNSSRSLADAPSNQFSSLLADSDLSLNGLLSSEEHQHKRLYAKPVIKADETPDPPLETLVREDSASIVQPREPISNYFWIILALVSFILLESGHGYLVGHSMLTLFSLTVGSLFFLNRIQTNSTVGSVVSTVLILCGLKASLVKLIIKTAEVVVTVNKYFVVYFTTFLLVFQIYQFAITNQVLQS
jgi:hypothetical protein